MIYKLPKKDDPFKNDIERITKELKNKNIPKISEIEQKEQLEKIKENLPQLKNEIMELIDSLKVDISIYDVNETCPCGSGKKYKKCCNNKGKLNNA